MRVLRQNVSNFLATSLKYLKKTHFVRFFFTFDTAYRTWGRPIALRMAPSCTTYQHKNTRYSTELTPVSPHSEHHHCYTICVEFFVTGTIRIGGALVLGILIVLVSLRVSAKGDDTSSEDTLALSAPERTYIESQDSDGDGVKDWEEVLQERFIDTISATSSENLGFDATENMYPNHPHGQVF